jgi:hypothetical protein
MACASVNFDQDLRTARALRHVVADYVWTRQDGSLICEGPNGAYIVNLEDGTCSCGDFIHRAAKCGGSCKHLVAAAHMTLEESGPAEVPAAPAPVETYRVAGINRRTMLERTIETGLTREAALALREKVMRDPVRMGWSIFIEREGQRW